MLNDDPNSLPGLLYVDDEDKALKYFRMAFSSKFRIFTALSGAEGLEILKRERGNIAIVLSDQRMPGMLGAEFLGHARSMTPNAVRILTTAYSDLDSAIQAVNRGHIYQYVVKPWEVEDLGMVLHRAAGYHHVLAERDALLGVKMTTLQRILCSDRVKWLLLHSRSLSDRKQAAFRRALAAFVKALPEETNPVVTAGAGFQQRDFDIAALIRSEFLNAARCLDLMASWAAPSASHPLPDALAAQVNALASADSGEVWSVPDSLRSFLAALIESRGLAPEELALEVDPALNITIALQPASFDREGFLRALFGLLVEKQAAELSVRFFEILLAASLAGGSLALVVKPPSGEALSLAINPAGEPDDVESIISGLYEKFSEADISQL